MSMLLAIALAALVTVVLASIAIATVEPLSISWPVLLLGLHSVVTAALLVVRHRYA